MPTIFVSITKLPTSTNKKCFTALKRLDIKQERKSCSWKSSNRCPNSKIQSQPLTCVYTLLRTTCKYIMYGYTAETVRKKKEVFLALMPRQVSYTSKIQCQLLDHHLSINNDQQKLSQNSVACKIQCSGGRIYSVPTLSFAGASHCSKPVLIQLPSP